MKLPNIIPWFAALNTGFKLAVMGATVAAILLVVVYAGHVLNAPQRAATAKVAAHTAQVETAVQGAAIPKVLSVVQNGAARDTKTQQQHEDNSHAFHQLPSAGQAIPDADADAFAQHECLYDNEHGSGTCTGLQQAHP